METNDKQIAEDKQEYRNQLATVTDDGKRKWVYPKKPSGKFYNARTILSFFLLAFLIIVPFIKVNGHQFLLFDFLNRNFILFGIPFGPHDFHLFVLAMIINNCFYYSYLRLYSEEYFADGPVLKLFFWKWFFERLNTGLKVMQKINVNLMQRNGMAKNFLRKD